MSTLDVVQNGASISNQPTTNVPLLPTIPYYVRVSINETGKFTKDTINLHK